MLVRLCERESCFAAVLKCFGKFKLGWAGLGFSRPKCDPGPENLGLGPRIGFFSNLGLGSESVRVSFSYIQTWIFHTPGPGRVYPSPELSGFRLGPDRAGPDGSAITNYANL